LIKIENVEVFNIKGALRGMRNPMSSWSKSDSEFDNSCEIIKMGDNDKKLAMNLVLAGRDHGKFMRQIFVSMDIIAPDYWWKEMDTYKVGTVANSTSTMHKLTSRLLTVEDFSWDETTSFRNTIIEHLNSMILQYKIYLNENEKLKAKQIWREIIQDLPMSYNYRRTWTGNYENLRNMYHSRKDHKLVEWQDFCEHIKFMPLSELITTSSEAK
jgi:hypothetical protein